MARKTTTANSIVILRRKIFVDTGGWYGVTSEQDQYHDASVTYYRAALESGASLLTTDYVLDETLTRLRYDFGHTVAMAFWERIAQAEATGRLVVLRVDADTWTAALTIFASYQDQDFSFTDCTTFVLAQQEHADEVFVFDHHFRFFGLVVQLRSNRSPGPYHTRTLSHFPEVHEFRNRFRTSFNQFWHDSCTRTLCC